MSSKNFLYPCEKKNKTLVKVETLPMKTISDRSQIIYQDTENITQDLKNKLSKIERISNKRKDIFQSIQNTLPEIRGEDITSIPEQISSRSRSRGRTFAPTETRPIPFWDLGDPENLEEASNLGDSCE